MQADKNLISETLTKIKDTAGNPAPLGLMGFGMTTVLLNIHNAGFYPLNTMILDPKSRQVKIRWDRIRRI